jgi:hypothetical protein
VVHFRGGRAEDTFFCFLKFFEIGVTPNIKTQTEGKLHFASCVLRNI